MCDKPNFIILTIAEPLDEHQAAELTSRPGRGEFGFDRSRHATRETPNPNLDDHHESLRNTPTDLFRPSDSLEIARRPPSKAFCHYAGGKGTLAEEGQKKTANESSRARSVRALRQIHQFTRPIEKFMANASVFIGQQDESRDSPRMNW